MLYGDYSVDFEMIKNYFETNFDFKSTKLRQLNENDIKNGSLTIQAEDDLDTSLSIINECI